MSPRRYYTGGSVAHKLRTGEEALVLPWTDMCRFAIFVKIFS
jgi:hypothetical protein